MKTFEPGFFALENFIVKQETFDAREPHSEEPWHVAYNVNDPFFRIMGASMVSVLENNPDHPFVFHLFTDGYSRDNAERSGSWRRNGTAGAPCMNWIWNPSRISMSRWPVFPGLPTAGCTWPRC